MLARLAQESGIETSTAEDLARLDRKRKGKKLSGSKSGGDRQMKDGTTHLAYKPEHAVDLDTGAVVAAELPRPTRATRRRWRRRSAATEAVDAAPTAEDPAECVTDKGFTHGRDRSTWKTRISEEKGFARWHGDGAARRAVTNNRPGCYRAWPRKPSSCAPRSSSAPLRTTSIAAACAGHGCAGARTCTSDTCSMSPATI